MADIESICRTFVLAATTGAVEELRPLLAESAVLHGSAIGDVHGREAISACLARPISSWERKRLHMEMLQIDGATASFRVMAAHGVGDTPQRFHLVRYGFACAIRVKRGMAEELWTDMCWADGNTWQLGPWQPQQARLGSMSPECDWEMAARQWAIADIQHG